MTTLALAYDEIARRLGITIASARRLVHRRRWQKTRSNDGRALVQVPVEFLDSRPSDVLATVLVAGRMVSMTATGTALMTVLMASPRFWRA